MPSLVPVHILSLVHASRVPNTWHKSCSWRWSSDNIHPKRRIETPSGGVWGGGKENHWWAGALETTMIFSWMLGSGWVKRINPIPDSPSKLMAARTKGWKMLKFGADAKRLVPWVRHARAWWQLFESRSTDFEKRRETSAIFSSSLKLTVSKWNMSSAQINFKYWVKRGA